MQKQTQQPKILPKRVLILKTDSKNRDDVNKSRHFDYISHDLIKDISPKHNTQNSFDTLDQLEFGRTSGLNQKIPISVLVESHGLSKQSSQPSRQYTDV